MLLRTCLTLFVVAGAWAQQTQPAKLPQKRDAPLTRSSFSAKGLQHEDDLTDFFVGNFADLPFDRGTIGFSVLFQQYMEAYGRHCDAYLPANKVELTTRVCADAPTPPNPYDPPFAPKDCSRWRTISLGYADPALYAAKAQLDAGQVANVVKDVLGSKNLIGSAVDALQLTGDLDALVRLNACDGAGLRRFQENVVLFSKGKQPLLLPGAPPPVAPSAQPLGVLADSDYNRLVEDLVADQARTWAFNRYVSGSTSHVIVSHDPTGRPAKILAKYLFSSPGSGPTQGSVTVGFSDGMPECIYFSDAPSACRTPGPRIIARYSSGGYRDPSVSPPGSSPAAAAPVQPPPDRGASAQPPPTVTRRSVNPAALAPVPTTAPSPPAPAPTLEQQLQQRAAERQRRAEKATDCRQQAVKDHPQDGVAMAQEYNSCLQAK